MIFTLVIASLAVVLRIIRQTGGKERGKLGPHKADGTGPNSSHMSGQPKNLARHPSDILQQRFVWPFVASQIGIQISIGPVPVIGSNSLPYRSKFGASAIALPEFGSHAVQIV